MPKFVSPPDFQAALTVGEGGTGVTTTPPLGGIAYGNGSVLTWTAAGTTGQVLTANTGAAPTWNTPGNSLAFAFTESAAASPPATPATGDLWMVSDVGVKDIIECGGATPTVLNSIDGGSATTIFTTLINGGRAA